MDNALLVVGEALMDIVRADGEPDSEHAGGSPANVALGLARLGRPVQLLTRIGNDPRGVAIRTHLEGSGVQLAPGSITPAPTSTAVAQIDAAGVAHYTFSLTWELSPDVDLAGVHAVHTGSIAAFVPPGGDSVRQLLERTARTATISYDPNARPSLMGDPTAARLRVERLVALSDVVKVSDEDLAWLAPGEPLAAVAAQWSALGPALVVVTLGGHGAQAWCRAGHVTVDAPVVAVVDTVGAGDSFMAGLLDHLAGAGLLGADRRPALRELELTEVRAMLTHAARIAAITCSRVGANPPTRAELGGGPLSLPG